MVKKHSLSMHYRAVGMVNGGLTHCPSRQAAEDWAKTPQTLDGPRPQRRDAGESQGQREEDGHESCGKNRPGQVSAETTPVNKEVGAKTDCETSFSLQVGRAWLFAALPAAEAAKTAQTAQTDSSSATETAGLRGRS